MAAEDAETGEETGIVSWVDEDKVGEADVVTEVETEVETSGV